LTALLTDEEEAHELLSRLQRADKRLTSPLAVWETAIAVARILDLPIGETAEAVDCYLALVEIETVAVPAETASIALDAYARYGKGRHPARLNFRDCFACACARYFGAPLMFKGSDFPQTDIEAA
jgi:ribonuclease VapC